MKRLACIAGQPFSPRAIDRLAFRSLRLVAINHSQEDTLVPAPSSTRTPSFAVASPIETDRRAMTVATALFFMVGFITCLKDVIIPHLKSIFELTYAEAMLVQFAFFSSYFVFSYPGGKVVDWLGYKRAMLIGLLIMSAGAIGFLPAANYAAFPILIAT